MFSQQPTTSTTTSHHDSIIERVLNLRRQLGINTPLSVSDPNDSLFSPVEMSGQTSRPYSKRDWLVWSQSPGEENLPEKGQENHR